MKLLLIRHNFTPEFTDGIMLIDGIFYGYTLEDTVRRPGEKIAGKTAVPEGQYQVTVEESPRFQKELPRLHDVPEFDGVLIHGGNTADDTHGCILVGSAQLEPGRIQGSLSLDITQRLKRAPGPHQITIKSTT